MSENNKSSATYIDEKLSQEQYDAIAVAVDKLLKEKKERLIRQNIDERINNVRLLLKNYRRFKIYAKNAVCDVKKANLVLAESLCDINSLKDELKVESIVRSRERTLVMIAHIDKMMKIYKYMCQETNDPNDMRRWNILFDMYLNPTNKPTADAIAEKYYIDRSTVFVDISKAFDELSPLIFGVAGATE